MTVIDDFRAMFNIPPEQTMQKWNGLNGLMEEGGSIFVAQIDNISWLADNVPNNALIRLQSGEVQGEWVEWAIKGLERKQPRYQQVDLTQMVTKMNRWGKENGRRRLAAGDFVTLTNGSKSYKWGYEVGIMIDISSQVLGSDPLVWIPNLPIPAAILSDDRKYAIFISPMIGKGDECPVISTVKPTASFEGFFS